MRNKSIAILCASLAAAGLIFGPRAGAATVNLLNATTDQAADFYQDFNRAFAGYWKDKTGDSVNFSQTRGSSSQQADAVVAGQPADVVTLNQGADVDALRTKGKLVPANWAARLPNKSVPFVSTVVFVVRAGNPKDIRDWDDLLDTNLTIVVPNPKISDDGRYSYLAAWGYALKKSAGDERQAREFVANLFANVPVLDTGGQGAAKTFAVYGIGDVLLTLENEAAPLQERFATNHLQVVLPRRSIQVENPVAWVDYNVRGHHTAEVSRAYLEYLYSDAGQELAAAHFFRPKNQAILARYATRYQPAEFFTVDEVAGGWAKAQAVHFADGGVFEQIYRLHHQHVARL
jgi:sulfate transport system substrate-binding protein